MYQLETLYTPSLHIHMHCCPGVSVNSACCTDNDWFQCFRYVTVGQYPSWDILLTEWNEGILFDNGLKRTEPWSVLEQDFKEGKQASADDMWIPWRETGNKARKGIHDRKLVIYTLLEAKALGCDLNAFMKPFEEKAYAASEKSKKKSGNTSTVMSQLVKHVFTDMEGQRDDSYFISSGCTAVAAHWQGQKPGQQQATPNLRSSHIMMQTESLRQSNTVNML